MGMDKNNLAILMAQCNWYKLSDQQLVVNTATLIRALEDTDLINLAEEYGLIGKQIEIEDLGTCIVATDDLAEVLRRNAKITAVSQISSDAFTNLIREMEEKGAFKDL